MSVHRLLEAVEALLLLRPGRADDDLVERLAGADAEDDAARRQAAQRGEGLRHDRRVVAQRRGQDAGAQRARGCVEAAAAPSQAMALGACPSVCRQGWKWSLVQTDSKPWRSAAMAKSSSRRGPNCSAEAL